VDFDVRLKALSRLAKSPTSESEAALHKEIEKVKAALEADSQYDVLAQHLDILEAIGFRFSAVAVKILLDFIHAMETRQITYSVQDQLHEHEIAKYLNSSTLMARAIEILKKLRYLETKTILHALLNLSEHRSATVSSQAIEAIELLANYDIDVFNGSTNQPGIGATPQKIILDELELLSDGKLITYSSVILKLIDSLLSPTIHGTSWSSKTVTLSQGATPALPAIADIRRRSIQLLKKLYGVATTVPLKQSILQSLNGATSRHGIGQVNEATQKMLARDSIDVLAFYTSLIPAADLQIIQKIEDLGYWIFYHAISRDAEGAALALENTIRENSEYQIYKTLIGYEGKFHEWAKLKSDEESWQETDALRKERALGYVSAITSNNYDEWRNRILKYAQTESADLATFPVFCEFLEAFATAKPELALRLLSTDHAAIKGFLISFLRGLWAGPQAVATKTLVTAWIEQGHYLQACARQFLSNEHADRDTLVLILEKARQMNDFDALASLVSVAASNYKSDKPWLISDLFLPALQLLTQHSKTNWIYDFWFRRESRPIVRELQEQGIDLVLKNLLALKTIEYQAEEILYLIAQRFPHKVLNYLCQRLLISPPETEQPGSAFDAVPFRLHKLNEPLSKIATEAVQLVREQYDGNYSMFIFRGARLLKTIFPEFPQAFEAELLRMVQTGDIRDCEFVLAVLRNYEGQPFIYKICKEIIRRLPPESQFRTEVAIAMESTGVVMGEFGLAEAYERKKTEVSDWITDPDTKVQEFAKWYLESLEAMSSAERKRAEEEITLRKHRYGEQ
jgi:hypothetical protein